MPSAAALAPCMARRHIDAMATRPCKPGEDLKGIWRLLLPDTPLPGCEAPANASAHEAVWRDDIEALAFRPEGRRELCMVHRRAFRALLGADPAPQDCQTFFSAHRAAFEAAAQVKILETAVASGVNFHLTSRDVARQLDLAKPSRLG